MSDQEVAERRKQSFKSGFKAELLRSILPKMLLQEDFTAFVDIAYGIDKRALVAECLKEVAEIVSKKYTLEDIKGGYCDE